MRSDNRVAWIGEEVVFTIEVTGRVPVYLPGSSKSNELWPLLLLFGLLAIGSGLQRRQMARRAGERPQDEQ